MHVIEWEFRPRRGREAEFLAAYAADGTWARLFARGAGFLGTALIAVESKPGWYRTIDRWRSGAEYEAFRSTYAADYAALDAACEALTLEERAVVNPSSCHSERSEESGQIPRRIRSSE